MIRSWTGALVMLGSAALIAGAGYGVGRASDDAGGIENAIAGIEARLVALEQSIASLGRAAERPTLTGVPGDVSPNVRETLASLYPQGHVVDHRYDPMGFWTFEVRSDRVVYEVEMCNGGDLVRDPVRQ